MKMHGFARFVVAFCGWWIFVWPLILALLASGEWEFLRDGFTEELNKLRVPK